MLKNWFIEYILIRNFQIFLSEKDVFQERDEQICFNLDFYQYESFVGEIVEVR